MLLLASQSPRRAELLKQLGINFDTLSCNIDETCRPDEGSEEYVSRLAIEKSKAGWRTCDRTKFKASLGSDTSVVVGEQILGKPQNKDDFQRMMQLLSSSHHYVKTAVAVVNDEIQQNILVATKVIFKKLTVEDIEWYWSTGEPGDKAGGYAIQGFGGQFIQRIEGSYSAVVGLPLCETAELLKTFGIYSQRGLSL
ncbi:septum formation inhibitor Maf [Alteromonadaceae bacterium M269]|nr:septum formation inhibitor Maf [Alteromonadaceae bacterium M269]